MVSTTTADNALKSFYLDAVTDQLNKSINPFLAQLKKSTANVWGKDVKKLVRIGINGGIMAGGETDSLPEAMGTNYVQFTSTLKNLYGTIEISDKAIRTSQNSEGAFVNLLNEEMDNMIKGATFNFGRMLFGDGSGKIATITAVGENLLTVDDVRGFVEGMRLYLYTAQGSRIGNLPWVVKAVDRVNKQVKVGESLSITSTVVPVGSYAATQGKMGQELTGLAAIFSPDVDTIYGVSKEEHKCLIPYRQDDVEAITEDVIQRAMDAIEEKSGNKVNFIVCSWGVRRALAEYYRANKVALPTMEIEGGYKAVSFNGIPVVADRFCPEGTMYLLNTDDFCIHQLCDWQWLEGEDGKVLSRVAYKPVYSATLVKYAELMCSNPGGQGVLTGITEN